MKQLTGWTPTSGVLFWETFACVASHIFSVSPNLTSSSTGSSKICTCVNFWEQFKDKKKIVYQASKRANVYSSVHQGMFRSTESEPYIYRSIRLKPNTSKIGHNTFAFRNGKQLWHFRSNNTVMWGFWRMTTSGRKRMHFSISVVDLLVSKRLWSCFRLDNTALMGRSDPRAHEWEPAWRADLMFCASWRSQHPHRGAEWLGICVHLKPEVQTMRWWEPQTPRPLRIRSVV